MYEMWWFREGCSLSTSRGRNFICSGDGGRISTLYVRKFGIGKSRFFETINMFQCENCFTFFAMEEGTNLLFPLIVKRREVINKNGRKPEGRTKDRT